MAARRRRARLAVAFAALLAGAGTVSFSGVTGSDLAHAAVSQARSLADLLDARSPGQRTEALLTKTKHARPLVRTRSRVTARHQSPKEQKFELVGLLTSTPLPVGLERPLPLASVSPGPSLAMIVGGGGGGGGVLPPTGGGGVVPPTGGGGPATFPTTQPRELVTPPSALPEPGSWATMLIGFGFIGWRLRRRARPQALPVPA